MRRIIYTVIAFILACQNSFSERLNSVGFITNKTIEGDDNCSSLILKNSQDSLGYTHSSHGSHCSHSSHASHASHFSLMEVRNDSVIMSFNDSIAKVSNEERKLIVESIKKEFSIDIDIKQLYITNGNHLSLRADVNDSINEKADSLFKETEFFVIRISSVYSEDGKNIFTKFIIPIKDDCDDLYIVGGDWFFEKKRCKWVKTLYEMHKNE